MELVLVGAAAIGAGFAIAERMLRQSTLEELGILLSTSDTAWLLQSGWADEDFPALGRAGWGRGERGFYLRLMKRMRGPAYGRSRKLLRQLVRIEDERQSAKKGAARDDAPFKARELALLSSYREGGGFEAFLAEFLEKRHMEMVRDGNGG
jgi:hypothetical protein